MSYIVEFDNGWSSFFIAKDDYDAHHGQTFCEKNAKFYKTEKEAKIGLKAYVKKYPHKYLSNSGKVVSVKGGAK